MGAVALQSAQAVLGSGLLQGGEAGVEALLSSIPGLHLQHVGDHAYAPHAQPRRTDVGWWEARGDPTGTDRWWALCGSLR